MDKTTRPNSGGPTDPPELLETLSAGAEKFVLFLGGSPGPRKRGWP